MMADAITSAARHARRLIVNHKQRRALTARLALMEEPVRILIMTEAAAALQLTPEDRKLRDATVRIEPPARSPSIGAAKPMYSMRILMRGWPTLPAFHPHIDPRVVEREHRERRIAGLETLTHDPSKNATHDPQSWRCCFRVLHWVHLRHDAALPTRARFPKHRLRLMSFSDIHFSIVLSMTPVEDEQRASSCDAEARFNNGRDLARRIAALAHSLANPAPTIRRPARRLAALPADCLPEPCMAGLPTRYWDHGIPENWNASTLATPTLRALAWGLAQPSFQQARGCRHDPG